MLNETFSVIFKHRAKFNLIFDFRIRDKELQPTIHSNHHHHGHHHQDDLGREGKYRRTSSPTICSTPNVRPSINQQKTQTESPARTPKRDSPATIAAKGKQESKSGNLIRIWKIDESQNASNIPWHSGQKMSH